MSSLRLTNEQVSRLQRKVNELWLDADVKSVADVWDILDLAKNLFRNEVPELELMRVYEVHEFGQEGLAVVVQVDREFSLSTREIPLGEFSGLNGCEPGGVAYYVLSRLIDHRNVLIDWHKKGSR